MLHEKRILLIIGGGIAAYKCLDLIRRLKERGATVRVILTEAAKQFVTPLSVGALSGERVFGDLFDLTAEHDIGHIRLSREADLLVVAPATADLMAKAANGFADDLASTALLATDKPVLMAPAMNPRMWSHAATRRNAARLREDGITFVGPNSGAMAERGEFGEGRMAEPMEILAAIEARFATETALLRGRRILVTSGPTHEPIDPVRYIANRSSGKQGHAIAAAAAAAGAEVVLVSGPVEIPDPRGVSVVHVESARDMFAAVEAALPVDAAIFAAAVADWRVASAAEQKIKKTGTGKPDLDLVENPDILASIARHHTLRPRLVVGFAAETEHVVEHARAKRARKGCDWIVANDVSPATGIMGGDVNTVHLVRADGVEDWPSATKIEVARRLVARVAGSLAGETESGA
ncbi:MAG: bifunctional phosphopantothenoylcysteine decarboxylase/phosphopantothenate--cysteine ligase CoaBC [Pseudomonadota bacterium]